MALRNDSLVSIDCGDLWAAAAATAFEPVCSAILRRAEETAAADAPSKGISPRATVTQAMVLAVPITPHVPDWYVSADYHCTEAQNYCRCEFIIDSSDIFHVNFTRSVGSPIASAIRTCTYTGTSMRSWHHWTSHKG